MLDELEDEIVFFLGLHGNEVHTVLAADVTTFQPVYFLVGKRRNMPTVEVVVPSVKEFLWS